MLEQMRNFTKGWIATAMLGLLIIAFGIWGVGPTLRDMAPNPSVAQVGKAHITPEEFQQAYRRQTDSLRRALGPDFDPERLKGLGLPQRVLNELVRGEIYNQAADELKLAAPDDVIAKEIRQISAFRGADGKFDAQRYQQVLRENGFSVPQFEGSVKRDLKRTQLLESTVGNAVVPAAMAEPLFRFRGETRIGQYVLIPPETVSAGAPPTDAEIKAYYDSHKNDFMAPEYRKIAVVRISPKDLAAGIAVSDDDVRKYYDAHPDEFITPEKRAIEQIAFPTEADAKAASEQLRSGKRFEAVAQERGFAPEDRALGTKAKADLDPTLADAVFSIPEGAITLPVQGKFGWVILRSTSVTPEKVESFEEAKLGIRAKIAEDQAHTKVNEIANALEDARAGGGKLEDAAKAVKLNAVAYTTDAQGHNADDTPIDALADAPEIIARAMHAEINEDDDIAPLKDGGYFVVRVDAVNPPAARPLDQVTPKIRDAITGERVQAALAAKAKGLVEAAKGGKSFEDIAHELGRSVQTSAALPRGGASETFSKEIVDRLFTAKPGEIVSGRVGMGDSHLLMKLVSVQTVTPKESHDLYNSMVQDMQQSVSNELATEYASTLEQRFHVRVNEKQLQSVAGGSP